MWRTGGNQGEDKEGHEELGQNERKDNMRNNQR